MGATRRQQRQLHGERAPAPGALALGEHRAAVSRKTILEKVWGVREDTDTRAIDNFIVRLRRYLEDEPARPRHVQTVRGVGYRFVADPD